MKAITWHGKHDVRCETVDDPQILNPRDAIVRITSTAICGSDLHLYDGYIPAMRKGDVLGHEFMGRVVETGPGSTLRKGERVVVPFTISCGGCFFCQLGQFSGCDNSNPVEKQDATEAAEPHVVARDRGPRLQHVVAALGQLLGPHELPHLWLRANRFGSRARR